MSYNSYANLMLWAKKLEGVNNNNDLLPANNFADNNNNNNSNDDVLGIEVIDDEVITGNWSAIVVPDNDEPGLAIVQGLPQLEVQKIIYRQALRTLNAADLNEYNKNVKFTVEQLEGVIIILNIDFPSQSIKYVDTVPFDTTGKVYYNNQTQQLQIKYCAKSIELAQEPILEVVEAPSVKLLNDPPFFYVYIASQFEGLHNGTVVDSGEFCIKHNYLDDFFHFVPLLKVFKNNAQEFYKKIGLDFKDSELLSKRLYVPMPRSKLVQNNNNMQIKYVNPSLDLIHFLKSICILFKTLGFGVVVEVYVNDQRTYTEITITLEGTFRVRWLNGKALYSVQAKQCPDYNIQDTTQPSMHQITTHALNNPEFANSIRCLELVSDQSHPNQLNQNINNTNQPNNTNQLNTNNNYNNINQQQVQNNSNNNLYSNQPNYQWCAYNQLNQSWEWLYNEDILATIEYCVNNNFESFTYNNITVNNNFKDVTYSYDKGQSWYKTQKISINNQNNNQNNNNNYSNNNSHSFYNNQIYNNQNNNFNYQNNNQNTNPNYPDNNFNNNFNQ